MFWRVIVQVSKGYNLGGGHRETKRKLRGKVTSVNENSWPSKEKNETEHTKRRRWRVIKVKVRITRKDNSSKSRILQKEVIWSIEIKVGWRGYFICRLLFSLCS